MTPKMSMSTLLIPPNFFRALQFKRVLLDTSFLVTYFLLRKKRAVQVYGVYSYAR